MVTAGCKSRADESGVCARTKELRHRPTLIIGRKAILLAEFWSANFTNLMASTRFEDAGYAAADFEINSVRGCAGLAIAIPSSRGKAHSLPRKGGCAAKMRRPELGNLHHDLLWEQVLARLHSAMLVWPLLRLTVRALYGH